MPNTKYSGKELVVHWLSGGGTVDLTADSRTFEYNEEASEIDVTTRENAVNDEQDFLGGPTGRTWQYSALDTRGTNQAWAQLDINDTGTLMWYPEGTASGKRKESALVLLRQRQYQSPYNDAVTVTMGGRLTSAITKTTVS